MLELRRTGANRYEIYAILKPVLKSAPSTIYAITKRQPQPVDHANETVPAPDHQDSGRGGATWTATT